MDSKVSKLSPGLIKASPGYKNKLKINSNNLEHLNTSDNRTIDNSEQIINSTGNGNTNIQARGNAIVYVYTTNKSALENEIRLLKEIIKSKDKIIEMLQERLSKY